MRFLSAIFLCLFVFSTQAQVKLPPKQVEQKAPVKQTVAEVKPANTGPVFTLKVMSNVACKFYVDGELKATVAQDEIEKLQLKAGEYMFKAVATENSDAVFKDFFTVTKEQISTEKFYEVDLQSIINEFEQKEAAERDQKIAAQQKAEADRIAAEKAEAEKIEREKLKAEREAKTKELLQIADDIKHFEGKIISKSYWENVPGPLKAYYKNDQQVHYYKRNKYRLEMISEIVNTIIIYDYENDASLTLSEMNISGTVTKTATLQKLSSTNYKLVELEYLDEYKNIAGYNCQKVFYVMQYGGSNSNMSDTKTTAFVSRDFTSSGQGFSEDNIIPFLMLDYDFPVKNPYADKGDESMKSVSELLGLTKEDQQIEYMNFVSEVTTISPQPVDDSLFSLTPPIGYTLTDKR